VKKFANKRNLMEIFVGSTTVNQEPYNNLCDPVSSFSCLVSSSRQHQDITHLVDIPPANIKCNSEKWNRNDWILSRYWSPEDGVDSSSSSSSLYSHQLTYGEVTPLGVRQLAYGMDISVANCNDYDDYENKNQNQNQNENDSSLIRSLGKNKNADDDDEIIFYDLGSGVARLVTQIYIDQPDRVTKAIGIELAKDRHDIGIQALDGIIQEQLLSNNINNNNNNNKDGTLLAHTDHDNNNKDDTESIVTTQFPVQLIHGDVVEKDLLDSTTHVYISSLCFPENVLLAVQEKLIRLPNIRVIAALNRLDLIYQQKEEWEERDVFVQMSWGASTVKIYHKKIKHETH
ncbi:MAG: hypothetical protein ACI8RD_010037, partial [Bacillariaceae sp.]|jgi:hypothetical protein